MDFDKMYNSRTQEMEEIRASISIKQQGYLLQRQDLAMRIAFILIEDS